MKIDHHQTICVKHNISPGEVVKEGDGAGDDSDRGREYMKIDHHQTICVKHNISP